MSQSERSEQDRGRNDAKTRPNAWEFNCDSFLSFIHHMPVIFLTGELCGAGGFRFSTSAPLSSSLRFGLRIIKVSSVHSEPQTSKKYYQEIRS